MCSTARSARPPTWVRKWAGFDMGAWPGCSNVWLSACRGACCAVAHLMVPALPRRPTPRRAAPEVCAGEAYRGRQADMWALGVSLYLFIFGELPFRVSCTACLALVAQLGIGQHAALVQALARLRPLPCSLAALAPHGRALTEE